MLLFKNYSCVVAFFLLSVLYMSGKVNATPIVGGEVIYSPEYAAPKYPYMVSLQDIHDPTSTPNIRLYQHFCGGTLLNEFWIVTAAHCLWHKNLARIAAVIGHESLSSAAENNSRYAVDRAEFIYYRPTNIRNDIALLHLKEPYKMATAMDGLEKHVFGNLPPADVKLNGASCNIIGYGATQYAGESQDRLIEGKVKTITKQECVEILGRILAPPHDETTLCALGLNQDTCQGDSGGPLICKFNDTSFIVGVVSHGLTCGITGIPSIYTSIVPYLEWISLVINDKNAET
ncbi:chymotrypsinogen A [Eurosta solidaginis]|uniref:chymotrypsinogen A n=1 Tax=Eurosta solidaginis TaxID=178769 RepID=UPI003530EAA1